MQAEHTMIEQLIQPSPEGRFITAREALAALQEPDDLRVEREKVLEEVSPSPQPASGCLFALLSICGLGFIWFLIAWPSLISCVNPGKQAEGKQNIGAVNRAQQAYYLEDNKFSNSVRELGIGIQTDTVNYRYWIVYPFNNNQYAMNIAQSKSSKVKSYVGLNYVVPGATINGVTEKLTLGRICESEEPTPNFLPEPTISQDPSGGIKLECPKGYKDLGAK